MISNAGKSKADSATSTTDCKKLQSIFEELEENSWDDKTIGKLSRGDGESIACEASCGQIVIRSYWQFNYDDPLTEEYNILNCRPSCF